MIGRTLSHYKVLEEISRGGMGIVYKALDLKLNREVALKVLPPELVSDPDRKRRFVQEAQAAAALNHPNIAVVYEIDEVEGVDFIAMELIEGEKLSDLMQRGTVTLEQAVRIVTEVADGLAKAHSKGIVHRDIKPSNIMVTEDGHIKIIDFGLAKLVEPLPEEAADAQTRARSATSVGQIMGTLAYMSPEQARGQDVDHRSDIFSLGVVLYEMLTGDLPFTAPSAAEVPHAIINDPAPPVPSGVPSHVVQKCLAKDPADRYQTADELAADLRYGKRGAADAKRWGLPAAVTAVVLLVLGLLFFRPSSETPGKIIDSLAVLPFENTRNDPEVDYLSDGIPESLIQRLAKIDELQVMARSTSFRFRGSELNPQEVGMELGVGAILTGRVVQQGESLNVLAELVDVKLGTQLWAEQYTRKIADLVTVQNDIAADISGALRLELSGEEQARLVETVSSDAYEAYLKGRYFVNKRTGEGFSTALTFFEQALAADANYALAHVGVADSYLLLGAFYGNPEEYPPSATMTKAMTSVRDALELDPNLAEAHTTLAYIEFLHNWDWEASETEFRRAIELKPDYAPAHQWYSELLMVLGRHDEAVGEARQALSLDPASAILSRELAFRLHLARRYDESIEQFRKTLELDPDFFDVRKMLIEVYWDAGMKDEALAESPNIGDRRESNSYRSLWRRIFELVAAGKTAEAVARIGSSPQDELTPAYLGHLYALADAKDDSLDQLEEAFGERIPNLPIILRRPILDQWRSDPRFVDLMRRMALEP